MVPRCGKNAKSTSGLTRQFNACKIPNFLYYYQFLNPELVLNYNTTNPLNMSFDNNEEDSSLITSNNGEEKIKPVDIGKQKPVTPN